MPDPAHLRDLLDPGKEYRIDIGVTADGKRVQPDGTVIAQKTFPEQLAHYRFKTAEEAPIVVGGVGHLKAIYTLSDQFDVSQLERYLGSYWPPDRVENWLCDDDTMRAEFVAGHVEALAEKYGHTLLLVSERTDVPPAPADGPIVAIWTSLIATASSRSANSCSPSRSPPETARSRPTARACTGSVRSSRWASISSSSRCRGESLRPVTPTGRARHGSPACASAPPGTGAPRSSSPTSRSRPRAPGPRRRPRGERRPGHRAGTARRRVRARALRPRARDVGAAGGRAHVGLWTKDGRCRGLLLEAPEPIVRNLPDGSPRIQLSGVKAGGHNFDLAASTAQGTRLLYLTAPFQPVGETLELTVQDSPPGAAQAVTVLRCQLATHPAWKDGA